MDKCQAHYVERVAFKLVARRLFMRHLRSKLSYRQRSAAIAVCAAVVLSIGASASHASSRACDFDPASEKLELLLDVPKARATELMKYIRTSIPNDTLTYGGGVESERSLVVGFNRTNDTRLWISFWLDKRTNEVTGRVKVCEFDEPWEPYWQYVLSKVGEFTTHGDVAADGAQSPDTSPELAREPSLEQKHEK